MPGRDLSDLIELADLATVATAAPHSTMRDMIGYAPNPRSDARWDPNVHSAPARAALCAA